LTELSAAAEAAHLTAAFGLVLETQLAGDRAAWVTTARSAFFPPDAAEGGVDLDALVVARVSEPRRLGRAADHLVRSGGFGLVVIDLAGEPRGDRLLPTPLLTRLLGLAREHDVAVLVLTHKAADAPSLHSLISLRVEARSHLQGDQSQLAILALKDKRGGPGWTHVEHCRGPAGLR
jgi:recombination protein RecA